MRWHARLVVADYVRMKGTVICCALLFCFVPVCRPLSSLEDLFTAAFVLGLKTAHTYRIKCRHLPGKVQALTEQSICGWQPKCLWFICDTLHAFRRRVSMFLVQRICPHSSDFCHSPSQSLYPLLKCSLHSVLALLIFEPNVPHFVFNLFSAFVFHRPCSPGRMLKTHFPPWAFLL